MGTGSRVKSPLIPIWPSFLDLFPRDTWMGAEVRLGLWRLVGMGMRKKLKIWFLVSGIQKTRSQKPGGGEGGRQREREGEID